MLLQCICINLALIKLLSQARKLLYKVINGLKPKRQGFFESIILDSKNLIFPSFTMEQASLFCGDFLFSTYLPPTKPGCWEWSLQLDFKLQELPRQEIFFCVLLSLKRNLFSRVYKYCHCSQWKQNTYLAECSMEASKSKGKQVGESKDQV